jgi:proteic killer suppression protein
MIQSFGDSETDLVWERRVSRKLPRDIQRVALRKLYVIHRSRNLNDLRVPPANHLEKLTGSRAGQHSIRINDQWRICFRWAGTDAYDVEIVDDH